MKRILFTVWFIALSIFSYAQGNVTKFLGIPIDGTESEMIQKLSGKGFQYDKLQDCLVGEFNGTKVQISIQTNGNKVKRLAILDAYGNDETNIKIRFNTLCRQFEENKRYLPTKAASFEIPEKEKISYEMIVNKKRYEAVFYQKGDDEFVTNRPVWFMIHKASYNDYRIVMFYENRLNEANGEDL